MTGWVDSVKAGEDSNWDDCKAAGLWGTGSYAGDAKAGDELFLRQSGAGWLAYCRLTTDPQAVVPGQRLPWPSTRKYRYTMGIDVLAEFSPPLPVSAGEAADQAGLRHQVQVGQFKPANDQGVLVLRELFRASPVENALSRLMESAGIQLPPELDQRDYAQRTIAIRRGQQPFRQGLLRAFGGACCISGSRVEATLEAAHIRPYRGSGSHVKGNGLLLRADLHTLFDLHLVTVMPSHAVRIAPELRTSEYAPFDGQPIRNPVDRAHAPNRTMLEEHNAACSWLA